jgi:putative transposase
MDVAPGEQPREHFAMDFMQDVLADARRFPSLIILDTPHARVSRDRGRHVVAGSTGRPSTLPARLVAWPPKRITVDNGPEFTGQSLDAWAYQHGGRRDFIDPGKPMQSGFLECFKRPGSAMNVSTSTGL